jgi:hypothetical protein
MARLLLLTGYTGICHYLFMAYATFQLEINIM